MKTEQLLFLLLRQELGEIAPIQIDLDKIKEGLDKDQKDQLFNLSKKHDLAHVIGNALCRLQLISPVDESYKLFEKERLLSVYRSENQLHVYQKIKDAFSKNSVDFIPLKGLTIHNFYPKDFVRTSCDIDILVKEEQLEKAQKILAEELGYIATRGINYRDFAFKAQGNVKVELHFSLKEGVERVDQVLERAWEFATSVNQTAEYELTNEFVIFYQLAHSSYHFVGGGCGIKPVIDLFVLEKNLKIDYQMLNELLEKSKLTKFYDVLNNIKDAWLNDKELDKANEKVANFIISGGAYGSRENSILIENVKTGSKIKYFFSRMFLPYRKLKLVYPVLQKHKWLYPFYQVVRWFSFLFGSRKQTGRAEIAVLAGANKQELDKAKDLLEQVGLLES